MTLGALLTLVIAPVVYAICPARTAAPQVDHPLPGQGSVVLGAAIRATVLLALTVWL